VTSVALSSSTASSLLSNDPSSSLNQSANKVFDCPIFPPIEPLHSRSLSGEGLHVASAAMLSPNHAAVAASSSLSSLLSPRLPESSSHQRKPSRDRSHLRKDSKDLGTTTG